jgi:hypothetical protein
LCRGKKPRKSEVLVLNPLKLNNQLKKNSTLKANKSNSRPSTRKTKIEENEIVPKLKSNGTIRELSS